MGKGLALHFLHLGKEGAGGVGDPRRTLQHEVKKADHS